MNFVFIPQPGGCVASREERMATDWLPIVAYVFASGVGGALTGAALAWFGGALRALPSAGFAVWAAAVSVALVGVGADLTGRANALPQRRRQVPRGWVDRQGRVRCAVGFGLMLGAGFLTLLHRGSVYAVGALALVAPSLTGGAVLGATYGLARALPVPFDAYRAARRPSARLLSDYLGRATERALAGTALVAVVAWLALSATTG